MSEGRKGLALLQACSTNLRFLRGSIVERVAKYGRFAMPTDPVALSIAALDDGLKLSHTPFHITVIFLSGILSNSLMRPFEKCETVTMCLARFANVGQRLRFKRTKVGENHSGWSITAVSWMVRT
jgi:hypothetical protein